MKKSFLLGILFVGIVLLLAIGVAFDRQSSPDVTPPDSEYEPYIEVSLDEKHISLVGGVVEEWTKWEVSATDLYNKYRGEGRIYAAKNVVINWSIFDIPEESNISNIYFELSNEKNFQNAKKYTLRADERSVELSNLFVDAEYFFRISVELDNGKVYVAEDNFKTKWSPRIIEFENLRNIRDIGGWKTVEGKTIKQGLIYRGCELDGATENKYVITQGGLDLMINGLNIKSELDLRASNLEGTKDMLGIGVNHQYFSFLSYSEIFTEYGANKLREVFGALSKEENYPIYLHCTYGADRTGTVCYILEALLGMSEEDCYREWELSILTNGGAFYDEMDVFVDAIQKIKGSTLQEKVENYLISIGVTEIEIENIRKIMLEDYASSGNGMDENVVS